MLRPFALTCSLFALALAVPAQPLSAAPATAKHDPALDTFARDLDRVESVRAVKALQNAYAQYALFGLWNQVGALFAPSGQFIFDGQIKAAQTARGPAAIAAFLRTRYGGGREGAAADSLSTMMIDNPVVNLSVDGNSAKARWDALIYHGQGANARAEGGIFENDYVRERGVWKIATAHFYPQYEGPYEKGWVNWGGGDLPIVPYHFTIDSSGVPIPPAVGPAPAAKATLAVLGQRAERLNEEDRIRNLQAIFGFYQDRKLWDDVVDLFADNGVVEVGTQGVWRGKAGVRKWLEAAMGPAGVRHGQLNDRVQFNMTVSISPGGNEAWARGTELGMLGEADQEKGWWEISVFRNRFVKENGVWKLREMRRFPIMKTDVFKGWGKDRFYDPAPTGAGKPDEAVPAADVAALGLALPAFLAPHPVTGKAVGPVGAAKVVGASPLTGTIPGSTPAPITLAEASRRLARAAAFDGAMNVSAAYGYYLDDNNPQGFGGIIAEKGFKMSPFSGYYITRDRVLKARVTGKVPETRAGISYHWLIQPVNLISDDGRSVTSHIRLFQPRTGKQVDKDGNSLGANFWGGIYYDQYVLENGIWRLWNLTLNEPFVVPVAWKDGIWAKSKDPENAQRNMQGGNFPPDVPLTALGKRFEHYWGGPGQTVQWPSIQPMWFEFRNPVSGRVPELFQEDCAPCSVRPDLRLDRNGWQQTPDAPEANRAP